MRDDVVVRLERLPYRVKGFTSVSPDGYYNVYLNDRLTYEQRQETLRHEMRHISEGHFDRDMSFLDAESEE